MYQKTTLRNGIRIIKVPNGNIETVTVMAIFTAGSRDEAAGTEGMAHFLEHMFFKGTDKRPRAADINKDLDRVGASSNAFTGKEYTGFWAKTEKKDLPLALDVISDILLHSRFDSRELENEKGAVIEEINMYEDAPMRDIPAVLENMLYAGQSLGHDPLGTKENVRGFTRGNLLRFYRKHYTADRLVVAVSGNFHDGRIDQAIARAFTGLARAGRPLKRRRCAERQTGTQLTVKYKKTDQTNFSLGFRTFGEGHPDEYVLAVLDTILGGGSSSRLYELVREQRGLAYYIYTYTETFQDAGYLAVQSGVGNDKCEQALGLVLAELRRIKEEAVPAEEIERAKSCIKGRMAIGLESSSAMANFVTMQEIATGEVLTPAEKFAKINAVTAEQLQRLAREIFTPERLNLAVIGPFRSKKNFEKLLNI